MIVSSILRPALAALCLVSVSPAPASAYEFTKTGKPFETLLKEGYRIVAAASTPGDPIPVLFLVKDLSPDTFSCLARVRDCLMLIDSPDNDLLGPGASSGPQINPR